MRPKTRILTPPSATQPDFAIVEARMGLTTVTFKCYTDERDSEPQKAYTGHELTPLSIHKVDSKLLHDMRVYADIELEEWQLSQYAPSPAELAAIEAEDLRQKEYQFAEMCKMY